MLKNKIKTAFRYIISIQIIALSSTILARDIDLDKIYLTPTSNVYRDLLLTKLDNYQKTGAVFIERDIIFSEWINGNELFFIIEKGERNFLCSYNLISREKTKIAEINGTISSARLTGNKKYALVKRVFIGEDLYPRSELIAIYLKKGTIKKFSSGYPFQDFTIETANSRFIMSSSKGLIEYDLDNSTEKTFISNNLTKSDISDLTLGHISPDHQQCIIVSGGGGSYKADWWRKGEAGLLTELDSFSSATELYWLDNQTIAGRTGGAGDYSITLYNLISRKKTPLIRGSINTGLTWSAEAGILVFLDEQTINYYFSKNGKSFDTGLEGEEVYFSPDGQNFSALLYSKLLIVNRKNLEANRLSLKKGWGKIISLYQSALSNKAYWENEYTESYLKKKIDVYKGLLGKY